MTMFSVWNGSPNIIGQYYPDHKWSLESSRCQTASLQCSMLVLNWHKKDLILHKLSQIVLVFCSWCHPVLRCTLSQLIHYMSSFGGNGRTGLLVVNCLAEGKFAAKESECLQAKSSVNRCQCLPKIKLSEDWREAQMWLFFFVVVVFKSYTVNVGLMVAGMLPVIAGDTAVQTNLEENTWNQGQHESFR